MWAGGINQSRSVREGGEGEGSDHFDRWNVDSDQVNMLLQFIALSGGGRQWPDCMVSENTPICVLCL